MLRFMIKILRNLLNVSQQTIFIKKHKRSPFPVVAQGIYNDLIVNTQLHAPSQDNENSKLILKKS